MCWRSAAATQTVSHTVVPTFVPMSSSFPLSDVLLRNDTSRCEALQVVSGTVGAYSLRSFLSDNDGVYFMQTHREMVSLYARHPFVLRRLVCAPSDSHYVVGMLNGPIRVGRIIDFSGDPFEYCLSPPTTVTAVTLHKVKSLYRLMLVQWSMTSVTELSLSLDESNSDTIVPGMLPSSLTSLSLIASDSDIQIAIGALPRSLTALSIDLLKIPLMEGMLPPTVI